MNWFAYVIKSSYYVKQFKSSHGFFWHQRSNKKEFKFHFAYFYCEVNFLATRNLYLHMNLLHNLECYYIRHTNWSRQWYCCHIFFSTAFGWEQEVNFCILSHTPSLFVSPFFSFQRILYLMVLDSDGFVWWNHTFCSTHYQEELFDIYVEVLNWFCKCPVFLKHCLTYMLNYLTHYQDL